MSARSVERLLTLIQTKIKKCALECGVQGFLRGVFARTMKCLSAASTFSEKHECCVHASNCVHYMWVFCTLRPESLACGSLASHKHVTKNCLKRIRAVSRNRAIAIDSKSGSWMRNCAFLSNRPLSSVDIGLFFHPKSPSMSNVFLLAFPKMAWSFLQHKSVPDSAERARNILGSFELQLLDPSCRNCCRVLVFLPLCAGTWDRSTCPACRDGSHILQPRLVRLSHRRLQRYKSHLSVMELHFLLSLVFPILTLFDTASWK